MSDRGELDIKREQTFVEIPRGRESREVLRVRFVEAVAGGRDVDWTDLREFYKGDDGTWRPGKRGISIRRRELDAVIDALQKIRAGQSAPAAAGPSTERRRPEHRRADASRSNDGPPDWMNEGPPDALPADLEKDLF